MSFGHFSQDGAEYIITRFPTPRPWENYLSNPQYGLRLDESGAGYSVLPCSPGCRITYASPGEPFSKVFYLRDQASGHHWSLTPQPVGASYDNYQCRHGLGYTIFELSKDGIETELRVFIPLTDPVEIWTVTIQNTGTKSRKLSLFPYVEWHLAPYTKPWDNYRNYLAAAWSAQENLIIATLNDPAKPGHTFVGFAGVAPAAAGFDCERESFLGDGSLASPAAVLAGKCGNRDFPGDGRAIAAYQVDLSLEAGEKTTVTFLLGFSDDPAQRRALCVKYLGADKAQIHFEQLRSHWQKLSQQPMIQTPEPRLDRMVNLWLKNNIEQLAYVIREGIRGYRDTLQDAMGLASFDPATSRLRLLEALAHQAPDGHALRQFSYNGGPHDLRVYNDSPLWLILATARYLKETGEFELLAQNLPFFASEETASVFEHLRRAVAWLDQRRGHHGLIRIDRGDWCDALDEVGPAGQGVSIWLSQAFHLTLLEFVAICRLQGEETLAQGYQQCADDLREKIERHAWEKDRYICAISDQGRRLGVPGDKAMEIYLNTQSWAIIGQTGSAERVARALDLADAKLDSPFGPLLLDPPYYEYDPDIGRLTVLRPGCGENGTVYVHAAVFNFLANLLAGRPDRAMEVLGRIAPMMEQQNPQITQAAPYSYVNSYVGPCHPAHAGRSHTNWYTSSASWTFFAITDWLLGIRPQYDGLLISPCLPTARLLDA